MLQSVSRRNDNESTTYTDAVNKLRVCTPESLIDTEFEYSLHHAKWETLHMVNNIPCCYPSSRSLSVDTYVFRHGFMYLTVSTPHNLTRGSPIIISGMPYWVTATPTPTSCIVRMDGLSPAAINNATQWNPAYLYMQSMFAPKDLAGMEIMGPSKVKVTTNAPHGFLPGSRFALTNTAALRALTFDGNQVVGANPPSRVHSLTVDTMINRVNAYGYNWKYVNPYDWTASKTVFFITSQVNLYFCGFSVEGHGLSTGDYVMYAPPVGDECVEGLSAYDVYHVTAVDANNFFVSEVMGSKAPGLHYKVFGGAMAGAEAPIESGVSTMIEQSNPTRMFYEFVGWFKPSVSGLWSFTMANSSGTLWLGGGSGTGEGALEASLTMQQDTYYALRIQSQSSTFRFEFQGPEDDTPQTAGNGLFFHDTSDYSVSPYKVMLSNVGTSVFGCHAFMKVHIVNSMDPVSNTFSLSSPLTEMRGTPVAFFAKGFGIDNVILSKSNVSTHQYQKYFVEDDGTRFTVSPYGALVNVILPAPHGVTWVVPLRINPEYDTIAHENHGLSTGDVVTYEVVIGTGPLGLISNRAYTVDKVSSDVFRLKPDAYSNAIDICSTGQGIIKFTCTYDQTALANTVSIPNHRLYDGAPCTLLDQSCYVIAASQDRFSLTTQQGSTGHIMTLPTAPGSYTLTYTEQEADGIYIVDACPEPTVLELVSPVTVVARILSMNAVIVHPSYPNGLIYAPNYMLAPGSCVSYMKAATNELTGLTDNATYRIQRFGKDFLSLQSPACITAVTDGVHRLRAVDMRGDRVFDAAASLVQGSKEVCISSLLLKGLWKVGDTIRFNIPSTSTNMIIAARNSSSGVLTLTEDHALTDGDFVFCQGVVYYAKAVATNQIALHRSYNDAIADLARIVPFSANGPIVRRAPGYEFQTSIAKFTGNHVCMLTDSAPLTGTVGVIVSTAMHPVMDGNVLHRPGDSGVEIIPPLNPHGQVIRQTRKYIKYQSGKGIQLSNAVNFSGAHAILSLTRKGMTAYLVTPQAHKLIPGTVFKVQGAIDEHWNGSFTVQHILDAYTFTFKLDSEPEATLAVGVRVTYTLASWTNVRLRIGMFDEQNGLFWEYDGAKLWAVKRTSVNPIAGTCKATRGEALVMADDGIPARYTLTLVPGDMVVLRGMSYKVVSVMNDSAFYIQPPYFGHTSTGITIRRTQDIRVQQSKWSLDSCDGTGLSGFMLDIHKTQMLYIDYSWYGAGKVRFGVKGSAGEVRYIHEFIHNNVMTEAYVRTGNLPVRYEVQNSGAPSALPSLTHWGTSVIMDGGYSKDRSYAFSASSSHLNWFGGSMITVPLADASAAPWPNNVFDVTTQSWCSAWKLKVSVLSNVAEMLPGTPVTGQGIAEGTYMVGSPFVATDGTAAGYMLINKAPVGALGASLQIGGDVEVVPSYIPVMSLRMCPSIRSGLQAQMGDGEAINRIQLCLRKISVSNTHHCDMVMLLNPMSVERGASWSAADNPSFAQVLRHKRENRVDLDGIVLQRFYASPGITTITTGLEDLIPLGNSILGGDNMFPDGPDVITIVAIVKDANNVVLDRPFSVSAQMEWAESESM